MGIISAIFIGLIVGAIAKFLMPGRDPGGLDRHDFNRFGWLVQRHISGAKLWVFIARANLRVLSGQS